MGRHGSACYRAPMDHLELVSLIVDDYDQAIAFFVDVLGFELLEDSPSLTNDGREKRWVVVRPGGLDPSGSAVSASRTGLLLAQADGPRQKEAVGQQMAGRVGFFLRVSDFDASYRRMVEAGVSFRGEPRDEPYGRIVVFYDIAGNPWDMLGPRP